MRAADPGAQVEEGLPHLQERGLDAPLLAPLELPTIDGGAVLRALVADPERVRGAADQEVPGGGVAVVERDREHAAVLPCRARLSPEDPDLLAAVEPVPYRRLSEVVSAEDLHQRGSQLGRLRGAAGGAPCSPGLLRSLTLFHGVAA